MSALELYSLKSELLHAIAEAADLDKLEEVRIAALGRKGDLLVGLTTSGDSANVVEALKTARRMGLATACLAGRDGGRVAREKLADHCLVVPGDNTARIQEVHILIGHLLCAAVDAAFAGKG